MSTILLAWELGGGLGHVRPLLAVARALAAHGHTPVFAIRELPDTWPLLRESGFPVFQAPLRFGAPRLSEEPFKCHSFADILSITGWSDPDELEPLLRAWDALIDRLRPSLAIADHAPALTLAARGAFPVIQAGTGFCTPPSDLPAFPALQPTGHDIVPLPTLLASIAEVQRRRGRPAPPTVPAVFDAGPEIVTGLPEFDPYRSFRETPAVGPLDDLPGPSPLPAKPRWFAYLAGEAGPAEDLLGALVATGIGGEAYIRGLDLPSRAKLRRAGIPVLDAPAAIGDVLARSSVIVHHGGAGLGGTALAAGRPQLLVPLHLEQGLSADWLAESGVALVLRDGGDPGALLKRLFGEPAFAAAAARSAARIQAAGPWRGLETVVKGCLSTLAGERRP